MIAPTAAQLGAVRREVRYKFQASQWLIDYFAEKFLIGRKPGITVADLERLADNYAARRAAPSGP